MRDSSYIPAHDLGTERAVAPRMSAPSTSPRTEPNFTMDALNLDTPMSTLRNLASLSKESISEESYVASRMTYDPIFPILTRKECQRFEQDPVAQGILSLEEAQQAFDMYVSGQIDIAMILICFSDFSLTAIPMHPSSAVKRNDQQNLFAKQARLYSFLFVWLELDSGRPRMGKSFLEIE
jgi:hypothetical protein